MEGRCETCRYWRKHRSWIGPLGDQKHGDPICLLLSDDDDIPSVDAPRRAHISGSRHEGNWFHTDPDFGCVEWEPKEVPDGQS